MPQLTPQQRVYIRKHSKVEEPDPSEAGGELNIVPFLDIVVNIIIFLLATVQAVLAVAEIDAQLPQLSRRRGSTVDSDPSSTLNLSVTISSRGLIVSGSGGKLAPGCTTTQSGDVITIPRPGSGYQWANGGNPTQPGRTAQALTQCAERIKQQFPDETRVIVTADPEIQFIDVVGTMDALRNSGTDELFPEVLISAGLR